jgi:hypothetical protein
MNDTSQPPYAAPIDVKGENFRYSAVKLNAGSGCVSGS